MPKIHNKTRVSSLDCETTGLDFHHGAKPFFVTMCDIEGEIQYWEADVDPLTRQPKWEKRDLLEIESVIYEADDLILQNAKFDFKALYQIGIDGDWPWSKVKDTLLAGHLLMSNQPHDLTTMALIYLRLNLQPLEDEIEVAVKEATKIAKNMYPLWAIAKRGRLDMPSAKKKVWKNDMWLPRAIAIAEGYPEDHDWWDVLADYANGDSSATILLYQEQGQLLKKNGLWEIYQERLKLIRPIYDMEMSGMTMSRSRTHSLYKRLTTEAEECRLECIDLADNEIENLPVNGMSNDLRYVLFDKFTLKSNKMTKGGKTRPPQPSADQFVLDHWLVTLPEQSKPYRFVKNLKKYRKRKTAIGYIDSYKKFWLPLSRDDESDVHVVYPSFNSTGTDTLRFSSQNPNAQQVSKQEETNTRYCFGPASDREWWSMDASNIELRIPAYESGEEGLVELFEHANDPPFYGSRHALNFSIIYPSIWQDAVNKVGIDQAGLYCKKTYGDTWYQWCKNFGFAVQYGALEKIGGTADKAAHKEGSHRKVASYFKKQDLLNKKYIDMANRFGYVETIPDKSVNPDRGYPLYCSRTSNGRISPTIPFNYHVQGTAMWWMGRAMIKCSQLLDLWKRNDLIDAIMISQVHDELIFDFPFSPNKENLPLVRKLAQSMESCGDDIGVVTPVKIEYHEKNW